MRPFVHCFGCVISAIALLIVILALGSLYRDWGGDLADRLLANARAPIDSEMPPTAHAIPYASDDIQVVGGQGDELSCSIPYLVSRFVFPQRGKFAPISLRMRQACAFHDYCYRHGAATYGYSQADCDYLLLEHAYRICRFINEQFSVDRCVRDARKVLLGVRVFGAENFKRADHIGKTFHRSVDEPCSHARKKSVADDRQIIDDDCASSYFEFNPYPIRAPSHHVYRISDAPSGATELMPKALYGFKIRASGMQMVMLAWRRSDHSAVCIGYDLPGASRYLTVPPLVVHSGGPQGEDWFAWWQRYDLDNTGGRLTIVAPGRARLGDWQAVFPGAQPFADNDYAEWGCSPLTPLPGNQTEQTSPAASIFLIGKKTPDDAEFSELQTTPGLAPDRMIRLMALRTHSCVNDKKADGAKADGVNTLCYQDILVSPFGPKNQPQEPFTARDELNRWKGAGKGNAENPTDTQLHAPRTRDNDGFEPDRYRNFVTAPFALGPVAEGQQPVFAWLRRGERLGDTYDKQALLRRATHTGDRPDTGDGVGLPAVLLKDFPEQADPVIVFGRSRREPMLLSLHAIENENTVKMDGWVIPAEATPVRSPPSGNCLRPLGDDALVLNDCAQAEAAKRANIAKDCTSQIDRSWLVRPPLVLQAATPVGNARTTALIVFTRLILQAPALDGREEQVVIQTRLGQLTLEDSTMICQMSGLPDYPLGLSLPSKPQAATDLTESARRKKDRVWQDSLGRALSALRQRPVLVAELDAGEPYLLLPDHARLGETRPIRLR